MQQLLDALLSNIDKLKLTGLAVPLGALVVLLCAVVVFRRRGAQMPSQANLRAQPILTDNEREFFHRLLEALPQHHVFPQVAFSALLATDKALSSRAKAGIRNTFDRKYADFVICRKETLGVIAILELDDKTHNPEKDSKRDAMLRAAGYRIDRFESRSKPSVAKIAEVFKEG